MNRRKVLISTLFCLSTTAISSPSWAQQQSQPSVQQVTPLLKLNQTFGQWYATTKMELRDRLGPVVFVTDKITLLRGGTRTEYPWVDDEYTRLKTIDHGPLAVFVLLLNHCDEKLSPQILEKLKTLRVEITNAVGEYRNSVGAQSSDKQSVATRQDIIVDRTKAFIDTVVSQGKVSSADLRKFARNIAPATMDNVNDAIAKDMKAFDKTIVKLKQDLTEPEWKSMYVVLIGAHMPREQNTKMQYWLKLLGEEQEGGRVIYFEGPEDFERAMDLLVTHILDTQIAVNYFNDRWRMHRDLLSDGAAAYLKKNSIEAAKSPFKPTAN